MYSLPDDVAPELQCSLRKVVKALQHDIDELLRQKIVVAARIRHFQQQLSRKRVFGTHKSLVTGKITLKLRSRRGSRIPPTDPSHEAMKSSHDALKRACRIALMEAGGPANAERVFSLIVRRGSFVFSCQDEEALHLVINTLTIMHEAGELSRSTEDQTPCSTAVCQLGTAYADEPESMRSS